MNTDTNNYYMVLVTGGEWNKQNGSFSDTISDGIFSSKVKARKEIVQWTKHLSKKLGKYKIEVLHYTGTPEAQMENFWGVISI